MERITITDGRGTSAVILPEKGATVISLMRDGVEFLYCDKENLASPERPRCGIPVLFPIFGRLADFRYVWDGNTYHMDIHGFAHTSAWEVVEQGLDFLRLRLEASEETLKQYPFRFRAEILFRVADGELSLEQKYENLDNRAMPYNYGFHPYFRVERLENVRVETTAAQYLDFAVGRAQEFGHGEVGLTMPQGAPETGAVFFGVTGPTVLHIPAEGRRLTMSFDESFHTHVLWTQNGKKFLCVEPVNGSADGLNKGIYLTLEPGESRNAIVRFRAEKM